MINEVLSGSTTKPEVGMGASILFATDRRAATVTEVHDNHIIVQLDGTKMTYRYRKIAGRWKNEEGNGLCVGRREDYFDPSF
jgi:hypothetical protein